MPSMVLHARELVVCRKGEASKADVWSAAELDDLDLVRLAQQPQKKYNNKKLLLWQNSNASYLYHAIRGWWWGS